VNNKDAQSAKNRVEKRREIVKPDYTAWFRNDAFTTSEIAALAVGIEPDSTFTFYASSDDKEFEKIFGNDTGTLALRGRYCELSALIKRSLDGGELKRFRRYSFDVTYIPRANALEFIVDAGIFCEEFRTATSNWAQREISSRKTKAEVSKTDDPRAKQKALLTRERETALKLIIGMAIGGYGYNAAATRNSATKEIADDVARTGLSIDEDTVRKWLQEACEILPAVK